MNPAARFMTEELEIVIMAWFLRFRAFKIRAEKTGDKGDCHGEERGPI